MPHIVHLEAGRHLYGGGRQVLMLTEGLVADGIQCTLVCPPDSAISTAVHPSVKVRTLPMSGDLDAAFGYRFAKLLQDVRPDLAHVHSRRGADLWGGMGAKWAKIPAILSRRVDNPESAMVGAMKYSRYERIIGISNGVMDELRKARVSESKLRLVRSAVDARACQPTWTADQFRDAFGIGDKQLAVVCAAQFIPRKGHRNLLDVWAEVVSACPDARLLLFGQGPEMEPLQQEMKDSVHGSTVHFAGFRADLREFLGHADLLVHPAQREGLGVALLEAQAAGVPVLATRAGGIAEAVADGVSGVLVEQGNYAELGKSMVRLLRDAELRKKLGAGGRQHVAENFAPEVMVAGNLDVYQELLGAAVAPS
jgi:glycosyltransferase involved in cell wall biosynthesis